MVPGLALWQLAELELLPRGEVRQFVATIIVFVAGVAFGPRPMHAVARGLAIQLHP